jgi:zinc transport system ATP-binding protein
MTALVELDDVAVGYGGPAVVRDVTLSIEAGETVVILGANGSGKSTLVRGILGLADIEHGTVRLFGAPAEHFGDRWRIGYVPQRTSIAGVLPASVGEVVMSGRLPRLGLAGRLRPADREAVRRAIETVELTEHTTRPVAELSGGQQRRVTIARALAAEPDLLILDEPTAGVDAENQARLATPLERLRSMGTTIVVVAHEAGPVAHLIDRAVVMRDGRIAYDGDPGEVGGDHHHHDDHDHEPPRPGTGLVGW